MSSKRDATDVRALKAQNTSLHQAYLHNSFQLFYGVCLFLLSIILFDGSDDWQLPIHAAQAKIVELYTYEHKHIKLGLPDDLSNTESSTCMAALSLAGWKCQESQIPKRQIAISI